VYAHREEPPFYKYRFTFIFIFVFRGYINPREWPLIIKLDNNAHGLLFDALASGNREFFALLARLVIQKHLIRGGGVLVCMLITMLTFDGGTVAMIHVLLDFLIMFLNVIHDTVLDGPFEEIQLSNGGFHVFFIVIWNLDAVPTTKRVETFLAIRLEFQFVIVIHLESRGARGAGHFQVIHRVVFFGVIGDKPIHNAEGNVGFAVNDVHHFIEIRMVGVKIHEIFQ